MVLRAKNHQKRKPKKEPKKRPTYWSGLIILMKSEQVHKACESEIWFSAECADPIGTVLIAKLSVFHSLGNVVLEIIPFHHGGSDTAYLLKQGSGRNENAVRRISGRSLKVLSPAWKKQLVLEWYFSLSKNRSNK